MRFDVITIFPQIFDSYISESLFKRARTSKIISVHAWNLRDFSENRHNKVDDRPFGGGPGMVLKPEPVYRAVEAAKRKVRKGKKRVILFSTRGEKLTAQTAKRLSSYSQLILICGRYEGVDERVAEHIADEEISIGDYVLSGGEIPALALMEATARYIPGFLGKFESLEDIKGYYPVYTRPPEWSPKKGRKWSVPPVLLSGNHAEVARWRKKLKK